MKTSIRLLMALCAAFLTASAFADWVKPNLQGAAVLRSVRQAEFCLTGADYVTSNCNWTSVKFPHHWTPESEADGYGVYRLSVPVSEPGSYALLAKRLALRGFVQFGRQRSHGASDSPRALMRYEPQSFPLDLEESDSHRDIQIFLNVQGHAALKNGLESLVWGSERAVYAQLRHDWRWEVGTLWALMAAALMSCIFGLISTRLDSPQGRLLLGVVLLNGLAALRIGLNLTPELVMDPRAWAVLNLSVLVAVGFMVLLCVVFYLRPHASPIVWASAVSWLAICGVLWGVPVSWIYPVAEIIFALFNLAGILVLFWLAQRVWQSKDSLGFALLGICLLEVLLGIHDLVLHRSEFTVTGRYLLIWSVPVLLTFLTALLLFHQSKQRQIEQALHEATSRREELVRDLHDSIGSRLVALSFHARRSHSDAPLLEEIDGIIHELQVIQGTVLTGPTTLVRLLADTRHLFSKVGGGRLPLVWKMDEILDIDLTSEQAIATVRIVQEAVANALKHANPTAIEIILECSPLSQAARLSIRDDGQGEFQMGRSGGLRHMELRAQRAGLEVSLGVEDPKSVTVTYPLPRRKGKWRLMGR